MSLHCLLRAVDSSLGRLDYESLSDQALMEITFDGLAEQSKAHFQDTHGSFTDVCSWTGVHCNAQGRVTRIHTVFGTNLHGFVALDFLPPLVTVVNLQAFGVPIGNSMHGTLSTAKLPLRLEVFYLVGQFIDGTVDMTTLPGSMTVCTLNICAFTGSVDLTALPPRLSVLSLRENKLCGSVSLDRLPPKISFLELSFNAFSGKVCLEKLPASLAELHVSNTDLSGDFRLVIRESSIKLLVSAFHTKFSGTAVVVNNRNVKVELGGSQVVAVVDEKGSKHMYEEYMLSAYPDSAEYSSDTEESVDESESDDALY